MCKFEIYVYLRIHSFNLNFWYMAVYIPTHTYTHASCNAVTLVWGSLRLTLINNDNVIIIYVGLAISLLSFCCTGRRSVIVSIIEFTCVHTSLGMLFNHHMYRYISLVDYSECDCCHFECNWTGTLHCCICSNFQPSR